MIGYLLITHFEIYCRLDLNPKTVVKSNIEKLVLLFHGVWASEGLAIEAIQTIAAMIFTRYELVEVSSFRFERFCRGLDLYARYLRKIESVPQIEW